MEKLWGTYEQFSWFIVSLKEWIIAKKYIRILTLYFFFQGTVAKVLSREEIDGAFEHWNNGSKNRPKTRRRVDPM